MARLVNPMYYVKMRLEMENVIKNSTVDSLVDYIETHGELEDSEKLHIFGRNCYGYCYDMKNYGDGKIGDEFIISEDRKRIFYPASLINNIEIVND